MKKVISLLVLLIVLLSCSICAYAKPPLVVDNAGVLTQEQITTLTNTAQSITDKYGIDIVIFYTPSYNGIDAGEFTDRVQQNGYDKNCIIFSLAISDRQYFYYACGEGSNVVTDYGSYYIDENVLPELKNNNYYKAASRFLVYTEEFLNHYKTTGHAYDVNDKPSSLKMILLTVLGSTGIGLLLAGLPLINQKKKLNTVEHKTDADEYASSKIQILVNSDRFVTKRMAVIPIPRQSSSGGGHGGGGTTFHTSSSGHSYSGHGGHF